MELMKNNYPSQKATQALEAETSVLMETGPLLDVSELKASGSKKFLRGGESEREAVWEHSSWPISKPDPPPL